MATEAPAAPVTEPKPATPAAPEAAPEEMSLSQAVRERVGLRKKGDRPAKNPEAEKPEKPTKPAVAPTAPASPAPEKPPIQKKKAAAKPASVIDEEKLGRAIAKNLPQPTAVAPKVEPKLEDNLSEANKKKLLVLQRMAKNNPANADVPKKFVEAIKKTEAYQKDWEAKNAGKKFNISDAEHADFLADNDVSWDDDEYVEALTDLKTEKAFDTKVAPEIARAKNDEAIKKIIPVLESHRATAAKQMFGELGDDFKGVIKEDGSIDTKEIERLAGENPIYGQVFPLAQDTEIVSGEMFLIARGLTAFDVKNPLHAHILNFNAQQEALMQQQPEENQRNAGGKMFATSEQWSKMSPEQRKDHWHFSERDLSTLYAVSNAGIAKQIMANEEKKFETLAQKRGFGKTGAEIKAPVTAPATPAAPASATKPHVSPPGVVAPRVASPVIREEKPKSPLLTAIGK